jgi:arylsulfatase
VVKLGAFLRSLASEPPIKPGTPDAYMKPKPGDLRPEEHLPIGAITQHVTSLARGHDDLPEPHHGVGHTAG